MSMIITGFMGSGKSTLGKALSHQLNIRHLDSDQLFIKQFGESSGIAIKRNPSLFRVNEARLIRNILRTTGNIVSLGGGAVESPETRAILRGRPVLWLDPGVDACWERVLNDTTFRPLAANYEDFVALYHKRVPLYRECARWHLQSVSPPEQLVKEAIALTGIRA